MTHNQGNLGTLLETALEKLRQLDHFDEYMRYLNEEWYYTTEDLRLAREDEKIWSSLRFPSRLKIELAKLLDSTEAEVVESAIADDQEPEYSVEQPEYSVPANEHQDDAIWNSWVKCWAAEHQCYYFYNTITEESSWEDPHNGDGTVYDLYQYSEEEQRWIAIDESYPPDSEGANPFDISDRSSQATPKSPAPGKSPLRADSKHSAENSDRGHKHNDSNGSAGFDYKLGDGTARTFSKPRITPRAETAGEDRLFVQSPNRPKDKDLAAAEGRTEPPAKAEHKANYKYSTNPGGAPQGGRGSPRSPAGSPGPGKGKRRGQRPLRVNMYALSSEDSASDNDRGTDSPVRVVRRPGKSGGQSAQAPTVSTNVAEEAGGPADRAKRHSPLNSRPGGWGGPADAAAGERVSPKKGGAVATAGRGSAATHSESGADAKDTALPKVKFRRHPSHMYDWDSKRADGAAGGNGSNEVGGGESGHHYDVAGGAAAAGKSGPVMMSLPDNDGSKQQEGEAPYDFYRDFDYDSTEAKYATGAGEGGAYADGAGAAGEGYDPAYYGYSDEQYGGSEAWQVEESSKTYYDQAGQDAYITADSAGWEGYDQSQQAQYEQWELSGTATEEEAAGYSSRDEYSGLANTDYAAEYAALKGTAKQPTTQPQKGLEQWSGRAGIALAKKKEYQRHSYQQQQRSPQQALEESHYHHVAEPSAPPVHADQDAYTSAPMARFSPVGRSPRYRQDKSVSPNVRQPPADASPIATPVRYEPGDQEADEDFYLVEAHPADAYNNYITPREEEYPFYDGPAVQQHRQQQGQGQRQGQGGQDADLMALAMGSPGSNASPAAPPPRSKKGKITKLFRLNLFGKGPALPSTPPPPRDNSQDRDLSSGANPHSSAYRQSKMLERKASRGSNKEGSQRSHNSSSASLRADAAIEGTGSSVGRASAGPAPVADKSNLNLRRKPQPAAPDSAEVLASQERYLAAQRDHNHGHSNAHRMPPFASKEREIHYRNLQKLMDMGFEESESIIALDMCGDNLGDATQMLLEGQRGSR